jgi:hypothetical protein
MYEPESHGENEWRLPEQLSEHMKKFLKDFSALELKNMREDCPRPSEDFLSPRPMDKEMWKLIPQKAMERAKDTDGMFRAIFMAAADLMGPMGKAWTSMHQAKQELMENQEPSCDLDQVLTNLEQSAVLMAHLLYLIEEKRRLCSLRAFLKEPKAASQLLREAEDENQAWQSQPNTLFGKDFFTDSLKSKAKEGRDLQDVKKSLGWAKPQPRAPVRQPFHGGPPGTPRLQWGQYGQFSRPYPHGNTNRSGAPRQKGPGKPGPAATVSKAKTSGGKSSDSKYRYVPYFPWGVAYWPSNTYYARTEPTFQGPGTRLGLHGQVPFAGRWPLKIFHSQLESNHTRSDSAASSSRLPSRPGGLSQTAQSNSRAEIPTEGVGISKSGDSQLTGERSHCGNNPTGNEVLESGVYQGQERGGTETSDKPESSEPVRSIRAFQDGEHDDATIPDSIQRLDGETDIKDAYLTVPIAQKHQSLLGFQWNNKSYKFQVLPFGLGSAPRIFTKILKPVVAFLRRIGIRMIIYLDDCLILNQDKERLLQDRDTVLWIFQMLGLIINWKKSCLIPQQQMEFLGFQVNSRSMMLTLPQDKILDIQKRCSEMLKRETSSVRHLAKLIGKLTASAQAVLSAPLNYRRLQMQKSRALLKGHQCYEATVTLTVDCKKELRWWVEELQVCNGKAILKPQPDLIITTDASKIGWGGR